MTELCYAAIEKHLHSLVPVEAGVGEGLDLHGWLLHYISSLHGDDGPLDALLQVDEAVAVALRLQRRDVGRLHPEWVAGTVGSHGVVDVHADGVVHFRRKARGRGRVFSCGQLENDTCRDIIQLFMLQEVKSCKFKRVFA